MFVVGALFGLVTIGVVVPCLIDVAVAPDSEVPMMTKPWWVLALVFLPVLGAVAWLVAGRPRRPGWARAGWARAGWRRHRRSRLGYFHYFSPQEAIRRHPAGRAMELGYGALPGRMLQAGAIPPGWPIGPDDDPEFLEELARRIHGGNEADNDV